MSETLTVNKKELSDLLLLVDSLLEKVRALKKGSGAPLIDKEATT